MKKLSYKLFYTFLFILNLPSIILNAHIVYTDIPDSARIGNYNLDLNNDGITDFIITHLTSSATGGCFGAKSNSYINVTPLGTNKVLDNTSANAVKISFNTLIDSTSSIWTDTSNQLLSSLTWTCIGLAHTAPSWHSHPHGSFYNAVDGYLGLELINNGNIYYGWMRMNMSSADTFIVKDYAYQDTPNDSINAGAMASVLLALNKGNATNQKESVLLFPNPASDNISLNIYRPEIRNAEITIYDILGKIIYSRSFIIETKPGKIEIDLADFRTGSYFLSFLSTDCTETKKLIITR